MIALTRVPAKVMGLVICFALAMPFSGAYAVRSNVGKAAASDPRIDKLKGDLEYASKEEKVAMQDYLEAKALSQQAASDMAAINEKIQIAESKQKAAQDEADLARSEFAQADEKFNDAVKHSEDANDRRRQAIVRMYQESANKDSLPSILSARPDERQDVIRKATLMEKYKESQKIVITESDKVATVAKEEKLQHEDARLRAEAAEKIAEEEGDALEPLRIELAAAQKKAKENLAEEQRILEVIKSKKSSYLRQIAQITAESNALAEKIRQEQKKQITNPVQPAPGRMIRPVSASINSPFGYRTHPIYGDQRLHAGIDFGASYGTAIKAAKSGKVIYRGEMSGYGNVIVIDHGGGISTLYAHQSSFAASLNQNVVQGQTIGYVGNSGNVTGAHLHWEVRVNGTPVDPMGYL